MSKTKEYYNYYKERGICVRCKKAKAHPGKTQCLDCLEKIATYQRNRYPKISSDTRKRNTEYLKRKKNLCVAFGVCVQCMQRDAKKGQVCLDCYVKRKKNYEEKQRLSEKPPRHLWKEMNLCAVCGEPVEEGKRLCSKHSEIWANNISKHRKNTDRQNHPWQLSTKAMCLRYNK